MKNILFVLFISLSFIINAQTKKTVQNKKHGYYEVTKVAPDKNMAMDETRITITFVGPTNTPARNAVKFICNNDSVFPSIDETGKYTVELDPGKYKMRFVVPYWHKVITDSIHCKKQTTTNILVRFEAQELKAK